MFSGPDELSVTLVITEQFSPFIDVHFGEPGIHQIP